MKEESKRNLIPRPPIVVVMGHIDHGKTTLLDFIRKTKIAEKESGGITQHVGAYEIEVQPKAEPKSQGNETNRGIPRQMPRAFGSETQARRDDFANIRKITFLDTPGHEAFSKMRSRGAKIADLAILVIAADDGIKAQTLEAIDTIKKAGIPFIVAINKIDKENADSERVKRELTEKEIFVESLAGKIPSINISAKTGQGIPELLEMILLVAEMEELKADPSIPASGVVVESHLDPKRGITATLIIQNGTLKKKMFVGTENAIAAVKLFEDFLGHPLEQACFSSPVKITGFDKLPEAGADFQVYESKKEAEDANAMIKNGTGAKPQPIQRQKNQSPEIIAIPAIIKADVSGSLEALEKEIAKLSSEKVVINILHLGVGNITENDIKIASAEKNALIIGFRVKWDNANITALAERLGITTVRFFDVIYKINEWLEEEIKKNLPQNAEEGILGKAEILKIFKQEKNQQIIGGIVLSGKIVNGKFVKILRRGVILAKGKIVELQHNRIRVSEVEEKKEFGALIDAKIELAKKDIIEIYDDLKAGKI